MADQKQDAFSITKIFALLGAVPPVVALLGAAIGNPRLLTLGAERAGMAVLTAISLLVLVVSLWLFRSGAKSWSKCLAVLVLLYVCVVLTSYALAGKDMFNAAINSRIFSDSGQYLPITSIATAAGLAFIASAILFQDLSHKLSNLASFCAVVLGTFAILGHAYSEDELSALDLFQGISIQSGLCILILGAGAIFARPRYGWARVITSADTAGQATRSQLLICVLPMVAGWFLLQFLNASKIGQGTAMAMLVIITVVPLALLILRDGRNLLEQAAQQREIHRLQSLAAQDMEEEIAAKTAVIAEQHEQKTLALEAAFGAQRLETVGHLTGGIAHDFNNLLMSISGNLQLLNKKMEAHYPHRKYVSNALVGVERGARLTSQLLTFSRSQKLNIRPVQLATILSNARMLIGTSLGPSIEVRLSPPADSIWVSTDSDQLELAVLNLAVNARDAMPNGGALKIYTTMESETCSICISDTGTGMTPAVLARAAEPFFTTKERGKGTGLGLAQVHGFTLQSGGSMKIDSKPGLGTTIEIILPLAMPTASLNGQSIGTQAKSATLAGSYIVVIDDEEEVRRILVDSFADTNCEVAEAQDAQVGIELIRIRRPDVVVCDFLMPRMNGAEMALQAQKIWPNLPFVFVSGYAETVAMDRISNASVLRKPFELADLVNAVESVVKVHKFRT